MTITVSPIDDTITAAIGQVLQDILPAGTEVAVFDVNRVPEPQSGNFVLMRMLSQQRLSTNRDEMADCRFIGSINGTEMTVSTVDYGALAIGRRVFGVGVAARTEITGLVSGSEGGPAVYRITPAQVVAERVLAAGVMQISQNVDLMMQIDVHGPNSAQNAATISTIFRDSYGVDLFRRVQNGAVVPLYTESPRYLSFINGASQYEYRWIIETHLQIDETLLNVPQQAAETVKVGLINVDASYAPKEI